MLRAIVIDDEEAGIKMVRMLALRNSNLIKVVASALQPEEGITLIEDYKPDVVFLDISMPTMNGFDLLARLSFRDFKLIFTTAHREYALQAIKNKAFDYLLKPIDTHDFKKCVEELEQHRKPAGEAQGHLSAFIEIQEKNGIIYIRQNEIVRLEASRSYTEIYTDNGQRYVASRAMRDFEARLDPRLFYRCHKSHVINLQKVQRFINHDGLYAVMSDGSTADISKNNKDEFLELLKKI